MPALLLALLLIQEAPAKDDAFETRVHNVEFLTREILDDPSVNITLSEDALGARTSSVELTPGRLNGEALVALIRNNIAEDTWEHASASIVYENGALTVTTLKSVQIKIGEYLEFWRGQLGKKIVIDAYIISADPALLADVRAEGPADRPFVLNADQVNKLLAAAREGKRAALIKSMRTSAHPGQRVHMKDGSAKSYIRDFDIQVAAGIAAVDPIPSVVNSGTLVDVRPRLEPFGNAITMELRITRFDVKSMPERTIRVQRELFAASVVQVDVKKEKEKDAPSQGTSAQAGPGGTSKFEDLKVQQPKADSDAIRTTVTVKPGETALSGATFRNGRIVAYLVRPAVVTLEDKPAPEPVFEEQRLLKLYDISPLTRGVQDFAGMKLGVYGPGGSGAALAGASFTLEESATQRTPESIVNMIRNRIATESWGNRRNRIEEAAPGTLLVRQRPDVLKEIEKFLGDIITARAQVITTQVAIIGFRKGSRAAWEAKVPALGPGGYFMPKDQADELLKESQKGGDVRLVEWGEVTSYPQQRVHVARLEEELIVQDLEPQLAVASSLADPVISVETSGFVLDARPHFIRGTEQVGVELRVQRTELSVGEGAMIPPGIGPIQLPSETSFGRVSTVACKEGHWTLVAIESRGTGDDAEDFALILRARANLLK